jgi:hypothetical protein
VALTLAHLTHGASHRRARPGAIPRAGRGSSGTAGR